MSSGLRIILVGKTGVGKSAAGNTILGRKAFVSELCPSSVTAECHKDEETAGGRQIAVIDTPGLFDTTFTQEEIVARIKMCISMSAPGPHAFLICLQIGVRFTKEEKDTVQLIKEIFGDEAANYTMVLFTHGDQLGNYSIESFIKANKDLSALIQTCHNRYHVFNNKIKDENQTDQLLDKIEMMIQKNGGRYYTNEMFELAEEAIKKEEERRLKELQEQERKKQKKVRAEIQREVEKSKEMFRREMEAMKEKEEQRMRELKEQEERKQRELLAEIQRERERSNEMLMANQEAMQRAEEQRLRELKAQEERKQMEWLAEIQRERERSNEMFKIQQEAMQRAEEQRLRELKAQEEKNQEEMRIQIRREAEMSNDFTRSDDNMMVGNIVQGTAMGAAAGSAFGPMGIGIGALVGGITGAISRKKCVIQ